MRKLIAAAVLIASASSASACVNGWDSPSEEQEFRSQYGGKPKPDEGPSYRPSNSLLIGGGILGVVGAGAMAFTVSRTRS